MEESGGLKWQQKCISMEMWVKALTTCNTFGVPLTNRAEAKFQTVTS